MTEIEAGNYSNVDFKTHIILQSNDTKPIEFSIAREAAKMSGLIKDMLEDQDQDEKTVIPIPNVNGRTLKYVIQYMEHHYNNKAEPIEKPLKEDFDDVISEWDKNFLYTDLVKGHKEEEHELLIACIMAANFLNIKDMMDLTCACLAFMMKGKTPNGLRALFAIEKNSTGDEEKTAPEENH